MDYLDPVEFTRLFAEDWVANRRLIAERIFLLATHAAGKFPRVPEADRDDAVSEACVTALRKLHRFNHRRCRANAYSYFSTLVLRSIARHLKRQHARRMHEVPLDVGLEA